MKHFSPGKNIQAIGAIAIGIGWGREYFAGAVNARLVHTSAYPNRVHRNGDVDPHSDLGELLSRVPFLS